MLDEASGKLDDAIGHMEKAVELSTNLPSYWFNLGRFYEKKDNSEKAIASYQNALNLKPDWRDLAFWGETALRMQALDLWLQNPPPAIPPEDTFWRQAQASIEAGSLEDAARQIAKARLMAEPEIEITRIELELAEKNSDTAAVKTLSEHLQELVAQEQKFVDGLPTFPCPTSFGNAGEYGSIVVPGLIPMFSDQPSP